MQKIELEELKKIELEILKELHNFCEQNNLRYYLAYGTLIGAIRHKGFIPWDDDIDVLMPRPDYDKFIKLFKEENKNNELFVLSCETNPTFPHMSAKLINSKTVIIDKFIKKDFSLGISVDIIPLDGLPDDFSKLKRHLWKQKILHLIVISSSIKLVGKRKNKFREIIGPFISLITRILISPTLRYKIQLLIQNNSLKYDFEKSEFVGASCNGYGTKERMPLKIFENAIDIEFEGGFFKAPKGYHEFLTNIYGDYMTLPPLKNREPKHNFKAYWKE